MDRMATMRTAEWAIGLAVAAGLQVWWYAGDGPGWLPVLTGPGLVAATLGINRETRRRSDPELAARKALRYEAAASGTPGSGGLIGARQG